jgi:hypothetical protein
MDMPNVLQMDLPDRKAARRWILEQPLDKRSPAGLGLPWIQALRYKLAKGRQVGTGANQYTGAQTARYGWTGGRGVR